MIHTGCSYLRPAVTMKLWNVIVDNLVELIKSTNVQFDTIVFRGNSGTLIAPVIASRLGKEILMVRKPNDKSHSFSLLEGNCDIKKYIIIDDFMDTGETIREILSAVKNGISNAQCVHFFGYMGTRWISNKLFKYSIPSGETYEIRLPVFTFYINEDTSEVSYIGPKFTKDHPERSKNENETVWEYWSRLAKHGYFQDYNEDEDDA